MRYCLVNILLLQPYPTTSSQLFSHYIKKYDFILRNAGHQCTPVLVPTLVSPTENLAKCRWTGARGSVALAAWQWVPSPHSLLNCKPIESNYQLETEQRARLKSTTLSSEEDCHSASPLHSKIKKKKKEKAIRKERRTRLKEAMREREEQLEGPTFIPLTLPHPLPVSEPSRAPPQPWQQIQGVLTRNWQPERQVTLIHRKWQCQLWYKYLILYCTASDLIKGIMHLIRLKLD